MLMLVQLGLSLVVGLSVLALIIGVRAFLAPAEEDAHRQEILQVTSASGAPLTLRELEMGDSRYERVIKPIGQFLLRWLGRLAPQQNVEALERKLDTAGLLSSLSAMDFLGVKLVCGFILSALIGLPMYFLGSNISVSIRIGLTLGIGLVGFGLPTYWLSAKITARQADILKGLPDAIDMMTICVKAGLGMSGAIQRVCDYWDNPLVEEFTRVITETRLGRTRIDALESMAKRTGVEEVISFVMALTMAERLGANISQVLTIQAKQMRIARRQKAEKLAREAAIKMLFPLVFLIFPAIFAVILGPAVPMLMETFS